MDKVIIDGAIVENQWQLASDVQSVEELPAGKVIVSLSMWQAHRGALLQRGHVAVVLEPGEEPSVLEGDLAALPLVAINFPAFKDGRGYSYARELRTRFGYTGEVRAVGDVLRDQLFYMHRCGFNAFAVRADRDIEEALKGLQDFTVTYQGDVNEPRPIYQRA